MKSLKRQQGFFGISGTAIASAVGALGAGALSYMGTENTNDTATANAFLANANAERLANTAHQREVADLIAAGLNPILSANKTGAAVPQQVVPLIQNPMHSATSSAMDTWRGMNEGLLKEAERRKTNQDIRRWETPTQASEGVLEGFKGLKPLAEGAIQGALQGVLGDPDKGSGGILGAIQSIGEKIANITTANTAPALDRIGETAKHFGDKMGEIVSEPRKYIAQRVNSAAETFRHTISPPRQPPGTLYTEIDGAKLRLRHDTFTGDRATDIAEILGAKDPRDRNILLKAYRQWEFHFKNRRAQ